MATDNTRLCAILRGEGYLATTGLEDYHAAQAVKAALRRRDPANRLSGVREALNRYRVTAWLADDGAKIEFRKNAKPVLVL